LALGRGAILYSGHVYGLTTCFLGLAAQGRAVNMITLPDSREPLARQAFKRRRSQFIREMAIRPLALGSDGLGVAAKARNALRRNEIVSIVIDQSPSRPQAEMPFLNGSSLFPVGPALLAESCSAPLVPFWIGRDLESFRQTAEIGPMHLPRSDPTETLRECLGWIEAHILGDPGSWSLWLHPSCELDGHSD
jgi:lauroyl/myristoyl acyltransferase